jgi:hypothetical protein
MFRFMLRSGRDSQAGWRGVGGPFVRPATPERSRPMSRGRRRSQRLNCEALEDRQMLSGFYIINMESGKALDNTGSSTSNGNLIQQWQPTGELNQVWNVVSLPDGYDEIINAGSGKALDDTGSSTSDGTLIQQWQYWGGLNQQWKIITLAGGNDEIVNAYSGLSLDDTGFSTSNGTNVQQWQYWGGINQQWRLVAAGSAATVTDYVVDASSGKMLNDPNGSTSNGTLMQQWQLTGGVTEQWTFISLADGNDLIVNADSGQVLDDTGSSTSDGTKIQQWQATGGLNQQWWIVTSADGNDKIVNAYSGLLLDDTNASTSNGNPIQQWQANGGISEQWNLVAAGNAPAVTNYIVNAESGLVLDNPEFSTSNGTHIQQYHLNLGSNQQWTFVSLADGKDLIVNAASGKVLESPISSTINGSLIEQYQPNGSLNQQWSLLTLADGNDAILNANTDAALDDTGASVNDGTLIQQWAYWGGLNQQWNISPYANPVSAKPYAPAPAGVPLFDDGAPSYLDVEQGQVGDCWLLASLAAAAARDPQIITSMFRYDGTTVDNGATVGLYTVRFYNTSGSAFTVNVDTELPWGGAWYDNLTSDMGTQSLWVALAEKAYAEANALGYVTTNSVGVDAYAAMNNGDPTWALSAITGKPASNFAVGTPSQISSSLAADWKAGDLIALCTTEPSSSSIVPDHCYAVVGYNAASSEPFDFTNPWGSNSLGWAAAPGQTSKILGQFWTNGTFISQNFTSVGTGTGAADVNAIDRAIDELTELSSLGGNSDASATIPSARHRLTGSAVDATTGFGSPRLVTGYASGTDR